MEQENKNLNSLQVKPSQLSGEITLPPSKSQTLRAILFAALGAGTSRIHSVLASPDMEAMVAACQLFGANVTQSDSRGNCITPFERKFALAAPDSCFCKSPKAQKVMSICKNPNQLCDHQICATKRVMQFPRTLIIQGTAGKVGCLSQAIQAGNSGLVLRFGSAVGALSSYPILITGDHSIQTQRPMTALVNGLTQLGANGLFLKKEGFAPLIIRGPLRGGTAHIDGADSQPVSALLIASCFAAAETDLLVHGPGERPWVALTLHWLDKLGIPYRNENFERYHLFGRANYPGFDYTVPGDLSSAAFPIVAALITRSELLVKNIDLNEPQGDKEFLFLLQKMGAQFEIDTQRKTLLVKKGERLCSIHADINDYIDAITILAVLACFAQGETRIYNAATAKQKECNRIQSIATELKKMGADIKETEDGLIIKGSPLKGAELHSYNDHRMALSLSVAALGATGDSVISPASCITKTYPHFVGDFNRLGAHITCI